MTFNKISFSLFLLIPLSVFSQSSLQWQQLPFSNELSARSDNNLVLPQDTRVFTTDIADLNDLLINSRVSPNKVISLPVGTDGSLETFFINYDPVMGPANQVKFSSIMTFRVNSTEGTGKSGRIGISRTGFYGIFEKDGEQTMLRHGNGTDNDKIFVYSLDRKMALIDPVSLGVCGTHEEARPAKEQGPISLRNEERRMRHFKLAIACTSGYAAIAGGTEESVMAKVVEAVNLLNLRYHIDFGFHMNLIDNNERLFNLSASTDYFVDQSKGLGLLGQNQDFLDSLLTPEDYDLAQVFTKNCTDVGGVVSGRACSNNSKARGVSCRSDDEDYFFTTFKHEMGHQFDGGHTFNACNGSTQYNPDSSYEPGAGSTILSYGNNCGDDNVGARKEYFHVINIIEMNRYAEEAQCGTFEGEVNHAPVASVSYPDATLTIPILTAFELVGSATDLDENTLTYNWEQFDLGQGDPLGTNFETGPLFASQEPRSSGATRLFPKLADVLSGVYSKAERLPEVSRELNFRMTVRDNDPRVGATDIAGFKFEATADAGPFQITFPTKGIDTSFELGQYVLVQWDVANTDIAPVHCAYVNIMHSTNDGLTFNDTLVARTPNDGSEYVMLHKTTSRSRIKIKADDNIFLDMSKKSFRVVSPATPGFSLDAFPHDGTVCKNSTYEFSLESITWNGFNSPVKIEVVDPGHPGFDVRPSVESFNPGENIVLNVDTKEVVETGTYTIKYRAVSEGHDTLWRSVRLTISSEEQEFAGIITPPNGDQNVDHQPTFSWNETNDSEAYQFELASHPAFEQEDILYKLQLTDNTFLLPFVLSTRAIFYWRVRSQGTCGWGKWSETAIFRPATAIGPNTLIEVNKQEINVKTNTSKYITHDDLYHRSVELPGENLVYIIFSLPSHGVIDLNGMDLKLGDTFTQQDLDNNLILYEATDVNYEGKDEFDFIVSDDLASILGPSTLYIDINDDHPASTQETDIAIDDQIVLMPNPAHANLTVSYNGKQQLRDVSIQVYTVTGQVIWTGFQSGIWTSSLLDLGSKAPGTYYIVVKSGNYISKKRLVKL